MTIAIKINGVLHIAEIKTPRCKKCVKFCETTAVGSKADASVRFTDAPQMRSYLVKVILASERFPIRGLQIGKIFILPIVSEIMGTHQYTVKVLGNVHCSHNQTEK